MDALPLILFLHVGAAAIWVGGMFFAYQCLRPVLAAQLAPPERLRLWQSVLARFFAWVWLTVILLPVTGMAMMLTVGMRDAPLHWHLMLFSGLVMIAIFVGAYALPYQELRRAVAQEDWAAGGRALGRIRRLVGLNLLLGIVTIALATAGRLIS